MLWLPQAKGGNMPERFSHSIPFEYHGQRFVQIGDAGHPCWCLVPAEPYQRVLAVVEALNLWDRAQSLVPNMIKKLSS